MDSEFKLLIDNDKANMTTDALEARVNELTQTVVKLAQFTAGIMGALTIAFERHEHDVAGNVKLPDDVAAMYQELCHSGDAL